MYAPRPSRFLKAFLACEEIDLLEAEGEEEGEAFRLEDMRAVTEKHLADAGQ